MGARDLRVGDAWSAVIVDQLTLSQLVRYAGASGDFIALHHDDRIARLTGDDRGVFAHGMLTMGASGRTLSCVVGTEQVASYRAQMRAVVYPGDTLIATTAVTSIERDTNDPDRVVIDFALTTTNQHGTVVLTADATAHLDP